MKIVIFTSNAIRHKFVANSLAQESHETLIISETKTNDAASVEAMSGVRSPIQEHFYLRYQTEREVFAGNDFFRSSVVPLVYGEVNLAYVFEVVKKFSPDLMFVFGSAIIRAPLLSLLPYGRFINLHLGLSPYYRGSGTNFWPFVNRELEYVGSTLLCIDAGIDTGDIVAHVRPDIVPGDNVHTVGCKVIAASVKEMLKIMKLVESGKKIASVPQKKSDSDHYYRKRDFDEGVLQRYYANLENGMVADYCRGPKTPEGLITLNYS